MKENFAWFNLNNGQKCAMRKMKIESAWLPLINITYAHALRERRRKLDRRKSAIAFFSDSSLFRFAFTPSQMRALSVQLETQTMRYFACIKWVKTFKFSTWRLQISRKARRGKSVRSNLPTSDFVCFGRENLVKFGIIPAFESFEFANLSNP